MRQKLKLVVFAALSAALTVAGLSIAAGGSGSSGATGAAGPQDGPEAHGEVHGFFGLPGAAVDRNVADVMRQIHDAVEQKAPQIADPIIQKAQDAGDITSAQADQLRALIKAKAGGQPPSGDPRTLFGNSKVRAVLQSIFEATSKQVPTIAEPIIQKAVDDKRITSAQADQIRNRLNNPPRLAPGRKFGPGFGHGPFGGHAFGPFDSKLATVLRDIHQAVEKKAPEIADPIIKHAQDAGNITSAQADKLRAAAQAIANGNPPGPDVRSLLGDAKVRKVVQDAFAEAAKETPTIADPIIKKAVDDKKITSAQAAAIRQKLQAMKTLRRDLPPFGGPGGFHREGPGGFEKPQGDVPGALPGGVAPGAAPAVVTGSPA